VVVNSALGREGIETATGNEIASEVIEFTKKNASPSSNHHSWKRISSFSEIALAPSLEKINVTP